MLFEQQKDKLVHQWQEMVEIRAQWDETATAQLTKPTLQKLSPDDDIEQFYSDLDCVMCNGNGLVMVMGDFNVTVSEKEREWLDHMG